VFTTSGHDYQTENDPRVLTEETNTVSEAQEDFKSTIEAFWSHTAIPAPNRSRDDLAVICYTSGTETASPTHCVPPGRPTPIDPETGTLSVGIPVPSTDVRIIKSSGEDAAIGEVGEIQVSGPRIARGYCARPDEAASAFAGGFCHTGAVGFVDDDGWLYLVHRMKDVINTSGFTVWPREVEDVLGEHGAVKEAAVVGVPDPYRGAAIKAFIALWPGPSVSAADLMRHCRERLSACKCPTQIELMEELPKTLSGKLLRRALRDVSTASLHARETGIESTPSGRSERA
jgi:long-chain acyl-CoA synthetase